MDTALRSCDQDGENPKFNGGSHAESQQTDEQINTNAHKNHLFAAETLSQFPVEDRKREGQDRNHQHGNHQHIGNNPDAVTEDGGHVDDRVQSVDVKEIGDQEQEHFPVAADLTQCFR